MLCLRSKKTTRRIRMRWPPTWGPTPRGPAISWDLRGADASFFTINGGVLQFVNSPDFEDPKEQVGRQHGYTRCRGYCARWHGHV